MYINKYKSNNLSLDLPNYRYRNVSIILNRKKKIFMIIYKNNIFIII